MRIAIVVSVVLLAACSGGKLHGKVVSAFGDPIAGVDVSVEGSAFKTVTDKNGEYTLDYAPGNFNLKLSKSGFFNAVQKLSIAQKQDYPVEDSILYTDPKRPAFFLLDKKTKDLRVLTFLGGKKEFAREKRVTTFYTTYDEPGAVFTENEPISFLDAFPDEMALFKMDRGGKMFTALMSGSIVSVKMEFFPKPVEEVKKKLADKVLLHTVTLPPGEYAWAIMGEENNTYLRFKAPKLNWWFEVRSAKPISPKESCEKSYLTAKATYDSIQPAFKEKAQMPTRDKYVSTCVGLGFSPEIYRCMDPDLIETAACRSLSIPAKISVNDGLKLSKMKMLFTKQ